MHQSTDKEKQSSTSPYPTPSQADTQLPANAKPSLGIDAVWLAFFSESLRLEKAVFAARAAADCSAETAEPQFPFSESLPLTETVNPTNTVEGLPARGVKGLSQKSVVCGEWVTDV